MSNYTPRKGGAWTAPGGGDFVAGVASVVEALTSRMDSTREVHIVPELEMHIDIHGNTEMLKVPVNVVEDMRNAVFSWEPTGIKVAGFDFNAASQGEYESLKGIGPVKALAIAAHIEQNGPILTPQGLLDVKGIGPWTLAAFGDIEVETSSPVEPLRAWANNELKQLGIFGVDLDSVDVTLKVPGFWTRYKMQAG